MKIKRVGRDGKGVGGIGVEEDRRREGERYTKERHSEMVVWKEDLKAIITNRSHPNKTNK